MVGVLPQPHQIITHAFQHSAATHEWITSYLWVCTFMDSLDLVNAETAKMNPSIFGGKIKHNVRY